MIATEVKLRRLDAKVLLAGVAGLSLGLLLALGLGAVTRTMVITSDTATFLQALYAVVLGYLGLVVGAKQGERVVSEGNYSLQYLPAAAEPEPDAAAAHGDDGHTHEEAGAAWLWVIGSTIAAGSIAALLLGLRVHARAAGGAR